MNGLKKVVHVLRRTAAVDSPCALDRLQVFLGSLDEEPGKIGQWQPDFFLQNCRFQQGEMEDLLLQLIGNVVDGLEHLTDGVRLFRLLDEFTGADD